MNTYNYLKIKEKADLFHVDDSFIPFNIFSQNIYSGINTFNLTNQSKFYNKTPSFITPLQVSLIGGSIIPPSNLYFKKLEVNKYFPDVTESNIDIYRKQILQLHKNNKIVLQENSTINCFEIKGSVYFDVFIKASLKENLYIDNQIGLTPVQIDSFLKMDLEDVKRKLEEYGIAYYSSPPEGIRQESLVILNDTSFKTYKVVSTDDIYDVDLTEFNECYINRSGILKNENNQLASTVNNVITSLSEILNLEISSDNFSDSPIENLNNFIRKAATREVEKLFSISTEPVFKSNRYLLKELIVNRIFNCFGLFGFDRSFEHFSTLIQNTPSYSIFKQNHILLQNASYTVSNSIMNEFNIHDFREKIDLAGNLTEVKKNILKNIKSLCSNVFYDKLNFSGKGSLTLYDFSKINYQLHKIGKKDKFENWISDIFVKHNFDPHSINDSSIKQFISELDQTEKKKVKLYLKDSYYEFKAFEVRENYLKHEINFQIFDKSDFFAFLAQNTMSEILPFLYRNFDNNYVQEIEQKINDDNKITFDNKTNTILDSLYSNIKNIISDVELERFHKGRENELGL